MKLKEIANIKTGLVTARKQAKISEDVVATYKLLNLKAINSRGYIEDEIIEKFRATENIKQEYITQPKDIVVRLTSPFTAVLIDEEHAGIIIPSHFVVIRPKKDKILPEYLFWLLNSKQVISTINQNKNSTMIGAVKPLFYSELDIDLLDIEEQKKIGQLYITSKKELSILDQLIGQKEEYYRVAIDKIQKDMRKR